MQVLVTGSAGFIGSALSIKFLNDGHNVIGIDNIDSYYSQDLKIDRLKNIQKNKFNSNWLFTECDLNNKAKLENIFLENKPEVVINLAAQAGVRYSLENPSAYINSNILGFSNLIELCKKHKIKNFIFASSSSVYGGNNKLPFSEDDYLNPPINLYAATKISNELIAHSYSHLHGLPCTGLRFFTVYGPWGRPDMAPMIFTKLMLEKKPIIINNFGNMKRDFTFIDDIVEGIFRCSKKPAFPEEIKNNNLSNNGKSTAPFRVFNIGNGDPIDLMQFIEVLEDNLGIKAIKNFQTMNSCEMLNTEADTSRFEKWINFKPQTNLEKGIYKFLKWYKNYYKI